MTIWGDPCNGEWMAEKGKRASVQVGSLGKLKTACQMISVAILLYACPAIAERIGNGLR